MPVVITDTGEIPFFITDRINGYLAKNNEPVVFARKMQEVVANYDAALEVGLKGRLLAQREFSADSQIKKLTSIIRKDFRVK